MADQKHASGSRPHLVLHKNEKRRKRPRGAAGAAPQAPEFQMIDCRPDLYERLVSHGAEWRWARFVSVLREWLFALSAKIGRPPPRNHNDN